MTTGPGRAAEMLQKQAVGELKADRKGMGKAAELQTSPEQTDDGSTADPLEAEKTANDPDPTTVTLEMLPDEDLLSVALAILGNDGMPEHDEKTGEYDREDLLAALNKAGVTEVDAS